MLGIYSIARKYDYYSSKTYLSDNKKISFETILMDQRLDGCLEGPILKENSKQKKTNYRGTFGQKHGSFEGL